jgi:23S rRNA pseudouridine1911/1915/1917 synthase
VRVNGARARKGTIVNAGDVVTIAREPARDVDDAPIASLALLYVDDELVAVDKPPALPSTAGRTPGPSVATALLARFPEMAALGDPRHAGLVHRLDTGTSGLLLAARGAAVHARLRAAFRRKAVVKDYLAVVTGRLGEPRRVTQSLARHRRSRGRMVAAPASERSWPATTDVVPIGGDEAFTVVRLRMRTGVTHQLRVHLAGLGHPIVGDRRYGGRAQDPSLLGVPTPAWHFLHARRIRFDDPDLPWAVATPFPAHWEPLFAARRWRMPADEAD